MVEKVEWSTLALGSFATVLASTDWKLLAQQKGALFHACRQDNTLDGLLLWIDCLQDAAKEAGYPVDTVSNYHVTVVETVTREYTIEAENPDDARNKVADLMGKQELEGTLPEPDCVDSDQENWNVEEVVDATDGS
jgi:hypothetical protein